MTSPNNERGLFVTFEGIDGSGKTTQANMLCDTLVAEGHKVALLREPGGTDIGEQIRKILLNADHSAMAPATELFLYAAARAQLTAEMIKPAMAVNDVVISDRYLDSTTVYQGYGRGIDISFIQQLNDTATESIAPDLTFVLDVDVDIGSARGATEDRLERETIEFKARVREGYRKLAETEPFRVILLDGAQSPEEVAKLVFERTTEKLVVSPADSIYAATSEEGRE